MNNFNNNSNCNCNNNNNLKRCDACDNVDGCIKLSFINNAFEREIIPINQGTVATPFGLKYFMLINPNDYKCLAAFDANNPLKGTLYYRPVTITTPPQPVNLFLDSYIENVSLYIGENILDPFDNKYYYITLYITLPSTITTPITSLLFTFIANDNCCNCSGLNFPQQLIVPKGENTEILLNQIWSSEAESLFTNSIYDVNCLSKYNSRENSLEMDIYSNDDFELYMHIGTVNVYTAIDSNNITRLFAFNDRCRVVIPKYATLVAKCNKNKLLKLFGIMPYV